MRVQNNQQSQTFGMVRASEKGLQAAIECRYANRAHLDGNPDIKKLVGYYRQFLTG